VVNGWRLASPDAFYRLSGGAIGELVNVNIVSDKDEPYNATLLIVSASPLKVVCIMRILDSPNGLNHNWTGWYLSISTDGSITLRHESLL
jgi:hypothetical protein